jgi:WD40 repeat protein
VLCCLEGTARDEAALQLGWSLQTLKSRLEQGRELLRKLLARRGVTLAAALASVTLGRDAAAALPPRLVEATIRAAVLFAAGPTTTATLPAVPLVLARGALRTRRFHLAVLLLALGAVTYSAVAGSASQRQPADPTPPLPRRVEARAGGTDRHGDPLPPGAIARLGTLRLQHEQGHRIAYSADGKVLASASDEIRLWDAATGRELGHFPGARGFALSADGKRLASSATQGPDRLLVRIWDTVTGKEMHRLPGHRDEIYALAFSPNGKRLATGSLDGGLRLWDPVRGEQVAVLAELGELGDGRGAVTCLAFSPDGKTLLSAEHKMSRLWEVATGKERRRFPGAFFRALSRDGRVMAVVDEKGHTLRLVKVDTGDTVLTIKDLHGAVQSVSIAPDGRTLATVSHVDPFLRLWDATTGKPVHVIPLTNYAFSVAFAPDGQTLAVGVPWAAGDRVRLWNPATATERVPQPGHRDAVVGVSFLDGGKTIASVGADETHRLWRAADGQQVRSLPLGKVALALSADGKLAATAGRWQQLRLGKIEETLSLWDAGTGKERLAFSAGHKGGVALAAFSPDGATLAVSTYRGELLLWDTASGKMRRQWQAAASMALAFSPDGKTLATGGWDCAVRLWDAGSGKLVRLLGKPLELNRDSDGKRVTGTSAIAFSPDGKSVAAALVPQNIIYLWEVESGKERRQLHGHPDGWHNGWVNALVFAPDGKALYSAGKDRAIHVWDVARGKERGRLRGHRGAIRVLALSPDGARLASGSQDGTTLVWDLTR